MKPYSPARSILIRNRQAVALVNKLAKQDHRSAANAAEKVIISALTKNQQNKNTGSNKQIQ